MENPIAILQIMDNFSEKITVFPAMIFKITRSRYLFNKYRGIK